MFNYWYRHRNLCVTARPGLARYDLEEGDPLEILHYGAPIRLTVGEPVERPIPARPPRPRPRQPAGREPARRRPPRSSS